MERYKKRLTANGKMRREHLCVWEAAHGPIPKGYVIHHIDGNGHNNDLSNLTMMTVSDHLALHHKLRREGTDPVDRNDPLVAADRARQRIAHAKYRESHADKIKEYYKEHRSEALARVKQYQKANKEKIADKKRKYNAEHKEEIDAYMKQYRADHLFEKHAKDKEYREAHREEVSLGKKI